MKKQLALTIITLLVLPFFASLTSATTVITSDSEVPSTAIENQPFEVSVSAKEYSGNLLELRLLRKIDPDSYSTYESFKIETCSGSTCSTTWTITEQYAGFVYYKLEAEGKDNYGTRSIDSKEYTIQIIEAPQNTAPQITSFSPELTQNINEGTTLNFQIIATDAETPSSLTYKWLYNDSEKAQVNTYSHYFDYNTEGIHTIKAIVSDGELEASNTWIVIVNNVNRQPNIPSNPVPADQSTNQDINVDISWVGGDIDGDAVTYDIYFGENQNPNLLIQGKNVPNHDIGTLNYNTQYYWKIIASDGKATSSSPVWSFTTKADPTIPNQLPVASFTIFPETAYIDEPVNLNAAASSDLDGNIGSYTWNFGDGTGDHNSGNPAITHSYSAIGTHTIRLTVTDNLGGTNTITKDITITARPQPPITPKDEVRIPSGGGGGGSPAPIAEQGSTFTVSAPSEKSADLSASSKFAVEKGKKASLPITISGAGTYDIITEGMDSYADPASITVYDEATINVFVTGKSIGEELLTVKLIANGEEVDSESILVNTQRSKLAINSTAGIIGLLLVVLAAVGVLSYVVLTKR